MDIDFHWDDLTEINDVLERTIINAKENYCYENWSIIAGDNYEYGSDDNYSNFVITTDKKGYERT